MNLNFKFVLSTLILLGALSVSATAQQLKIATIDLRNVFDNYWKTKQAETVLKGKATELEGDRKKMLDDYSKLKTAYKTALERANEQAVSSEEKDKRKKAAEAKLGEMNELESTINQFDRQASTTIDEQKRRMRDSVLSEIRAVIDLKSKSGGYTLVIDSAGESANGTPLVLFNNNLENDITKLVLAQLNETAPANRSGATPPAAPEKK